MLSAPASIPEQVVQVSGPVTIIRWSTSEHGASMTIVGHSAEPATEAHSGGANDRLDKLAVQGIHALDALRRYRPRWFAADIDYPEEDFSIQDLSGFEIDLPD